MCIDVVLACGSPSLCIWVEPLFQSDWGYIGHVTCTSSNIPGASSKHPMILAMLCAPAWKFLVCFMCKKEAAGHSPTAPEVSRGIYLLVLAWMLTASPPSPPPCILVLWDPVAVGPAPPPQKKNYSTTDAHAFVLF